LIAKASKLRAEIAAKKGEKIEVKKRNADLLAKAAKLRAEIAAKKATLTTPVPTTFRFKEAKKTAKRDAFTTVE
jgi:hypothetical protein